jgi:hypothetical protein
VISKKQLKEVVTTELASFLSLKVASRTTHNDHATCTDDLESAGTATSLMEQPAPVQPEVQNTQPINEPSAKTKSISMEHDNHTNMGCNMETNTVLSSNRFQVLAESPSVVLSEDKLHPAGTTTFPDASSQHCKGSTDLYSSLDEWNQSTPVIHPHSRITGSNAREYKPAVYSRTFTNKAFAGSARNRPAPQKQPQFMTQRRCSGLIGRGPIINLKPSLKPTVHARERHVNRTCIGVFITRMREQTTELQVCRHVLKETDINITCRPEKLRTRFSGYSSFLIQCQGQVRSQLRDPEIWPPGALVKPFYS